LRRKRKHTDDTKEKISIKEKITKALELPEEIVMDVPKLQFIGNKDLSIENYKGIIEYSEETIRINTNTHLIRITGHKLEIKTITAEEVFISGDIAKLEFTA